MDYLESIGKIDDRQHGSTTGQGCVTQLLVWYDVLDKLWDGDNIDQIYLNFESYLQSRSQDSPSQN
jgi:hypothetical protein